MSAATVTTNACSLLHCIFVNCVGVNSFCVKIGVALFGILKLSHCLVAYTNLQLHVSVKAKLMFLYI